MTYIRLIRGFLWDRANEEHVAGHNVSPDEAEEALVGGAHIRRTRQGRYAALGRTEGGRYLFVVFERVEKYEARIITARDMTSREKRFYKQRI